MPKAETERRKVAARLEREGRAARRGGDHDVYKHPARRGRIVVPRHRTLSPGVARHCQSGGLGGIETAL